MEISADKTKLMTNSAKNIQRNIKVKGQKQGKAASDDVTKPEILSRIAHATVAFTKLKHFGDIQTHLMDQS